MGWHDSRPAFDGKEKLGVAVEILAEQRAFGDIDLEIGHSTRLDADERPYQAFGGLAPWHPIGHETARRESALEDVVPSRKPLRLVETNAAHGGRYRERHRDVIVERGVVVTLTELTVEMRVQLAQASETPDDVGAHQTNQQPVHVE